MINRNNIFCRIANTFRLSKILFVDESCRHFQESSLLDFSGHIELCLKQTWCIRHVLGFRALFKNFIPYFSQIHLFTYSLIFIGLLWQFCLEFIPLFLDFILINPTRSSRWTEIFLYDEFEVLIKINKIACLDKILCPSRWNRILPWFRVLWWLAFMCGQFAPKRMHGIRLF